MPAIKPPVGAQLNRGHPLAVGLGGLWLANEGAGGRVNDASGYGLHGAITGATWTPREGGGLALSGTAQYVNMGNVLDGAGVARDWTIATWFRRDASQGTGLYTILGKCGLGGALGYYLAVYSNQVRCQFSYKPSGTDLTAQAQGITTVTAAALHCAIGVYTAATGVVNLYLDGRVETAGSSDNQAGIIIPNTYDLTLGSRNEGASNLWIGDIYAAGIWRRALLASEVQQLYVDPWAMVRPARRWWAYVGAGGGTEYVHAQTGVMIVTGAQAAQAGYIAAQAGALVLTGAQVAQALMQAAQVGSVVLTGTQAVQAEMVAAQAGSLILGGTQVAQADYLAAQAGDLVLGGGQVTQLGYTHAQAGSLVLTGEQVTQAVYTLAQTGALELSADQLVTVASIMAQTGSLIVTGTQVVVIPGVGRGWLPLMLNAGRYQ